MQCMCMIRGVLRSSIPLKGHNVFAVFEVLNSKQSLMLFLRHVIYSSISLHIQNVKVIYPMEKKLCINKCPLQTKLIIF